MNVYVGTQIFKAESFRRVSVARIQIPPKMSESLSDQIQIRHHRNGRDWVLIDGLKSVLEAKFSGQQLVRARILTRPRFCWLRDGSKVYVSSGVRHSKSKSSVK